MMIHVRTTWAVLLNKGAFLKLCLNEWRMEGCALFDPWAGRGEIAPANWTTSKFQRRTKIIRKWRRGRAINSYDECEIWVESNLRTSKSSKNEDGIFLFLFLSSSCYWSFSSKLKAPQWSRWDAKVRTSFSFSWRFNHQLRRTMYYDIQQERYAKIKWNVSQTEVPRCQCIRGNIGD